MSKRSNGPATSASDPRRTSSNATCEREVLVRLGCIPSSCNELATVTSDRSDGEPHEVEGRGHTLINEIEQDYGYTCENDPVEGTIPLGKEPRGK